MKAWLNRILAVFAVIGLAAVYIWYRSGEDRSEHGAERAKSADKAKQKAEKRDKYQDRAAAIEKRMARRIKQMKEGSDEALDDAELDDWFDRNRRVRDSER